MTESDRTIGSIYAMDVSAFTDEDFAALERVIDSMIHELRVAKDGVAQGVSPDPSKRPSLEQMRSFVAAHLP